jgi:site-specific recombinase XerD
MGLRRHQYLRPDERDTLLRHLEDEAIVARARAHRVAVRDHALFTVALASGLRASELTDLNVGDLQVGRSDVRLACRRLKRRGQPAEDEVLLPKALRGLLVAYRAWLTDAGFEMEPTAPLFPNRCGDRMTRWGIWKRWKDALEAAGIAHRPLHAARHTAGTTLYRATKDLLLVQRHLGHARPTTTAIYAGVLDEDVQEGVDKMWAP